MTCALPSYRQVLKGVVLYLRRAYDGSPPPQVDAMLSSLRSPMNDFLHAPPFESKHDPQRTCYWLRLGNRQYPFMKLVLEPSPDGEGYLFRADTHDMHICPRPDHPDYPAFMALREHNRQLAEQIELDWMTHGLPTFKSFLQKRLALRMAAGA